MSCTDTQEIALRSLSSLREADPAAISGIQERLQRALAEVDELHEAARVTPEDLRLHVSM